MRLTRHSHSETQIIKTSQLNRIGNRPPDDTHIRRIAQRDNQANSVVNRLHAQQPGHKRPRLRRHCIQLPTDSKNPTNQLLRQGLHRTASLSLTRLLRLLDCGLLMLSLSRLLDYRLSNSLRLNSGHWLRNNRLWIH